MPNVSRIAPLLKPEIESAIASGRIPIVDGAPNLLTFEVSARSDHLSHSPPSVVDDLIGETDGLVLNLSAGGTARKASNVVELEWGLFRHTDISADAHDLPFRDGVFDGVVCLNSFEHYHSPSVVTSEIHRVLKPGGWVYVLTAFLQPMHMHPHHYFNVTTSGLKKWFEAWDIERCGATEYHNVVLALQWIANSALWAFETTGATVDLKDITLDDLRKGWQGNAQIGRASCRERV